VPYSNPLALRNTPAYPHKTPHNNRPLRGFSMAKGNLRGNGIQAHTLTDLPPEQKVGGSNPLGRTKPCQGSLLARREYISLQRPPVAFGLSCGSSASKLIPHPRLTRTATVPQPRLYDLSGGSAPGGKASGVSPHDRLLATRQHRTSSSIRSQNVGGRDAQRLFPQPAFQRTNPDC
jgi:hypothetical protein